MSSVKIVVWEQDGGWLGYVQDYPDYWTQGESLEDLKEHLRDLYADLVSIFTPSMRKSIAAPATWRLSWFVYPPSSR